MRSILVSIGSFFLCMSLANGSRVEYTCRGIIPSQLITISFTIHSKQAGQEAFFVIAAFAQKPNTSPGSPGSLEMKWDRVVDASGGWETKYAGHDNNYSYYSHEAKYRSLDQSISFEIKPVILRDYPQRFNAIADMTLAELGNQPISLALKCRYGAGEI